MFHPVRLSSPRLYNNISKVERTFLKAFVKIISLARISFCRFKEEGKKMQLFSFFSFLNFFPKNNLLQLTKLSPNLYFLLLHQKIFRVCDKHFANVNVIYQAQAVFQSVFTVSRANNYCSMKEKAFKSFHYYKFGKRI